MISVWLETAADGRLFFIGGEFGQLYGFYIIGYSDLKSEFAEKAQKQLTKSLIEGNICLLN